MWRSSCWKSLGVALQNAQEPIDDKLLKHEKLSFDPIPNSSVIETILYAVIYRAFKLKKKEI